MSKTTLTRRGKLLALAIMTAVCWLALMLVAVLTVAAWQTMAWLVSL